MLCCACLIGQCIHYYHCVGKLLSWRYFKSKNKNRPSRGMLLVVPFFSGRPRPCLYPVYHGLLCQSQWLVGEIGGKMSETSRLPPQNFPSISLIRLGKPVCLVREETARPTQLLVLLPIRCTENIRRRHHHQQHQHTTPPPAWLDAPRTWVRIICLDHDHDHSPLFSPPSMQHKTLSYRTTVSLFLRYAASCMTRRRHTHPSAVAALLPESDKQATCATATCCDELLLLLSLLCPAVRSGRGTFISFLPSDRSIDVCMESAVPLPRYR